MAERHHVVLPGDSLWSIAGEALKTNDPGLISRFWVRIYLANRRVIGPNPHLIFSGQILRLPPPDQP